MNIDLFRKRFAYFANPAQWPDDTVQVAADMATCYIDIANSWYRCAECRELMTELITAHLLYLNGSALVPGQTNTGTVTNATVGSVSVGLTTFAHKSEFTAWLGKSPWGEQLLAMLARLAVGPIYIGGSPERRAFRKFGGRF